ncbi:MAG TPA: hypothetical protein VFF06_05425 [Polyangia bacterium]|nr:hypothetical protein [Polyangia bacterium]
MNEVKIDQGSVKGATMRGVDVTFDERGDVHITARGYKVTAESQAPEPPLGGRHYYLVPSAQRRVGAAQWDVDVYINEVFVHRFRSKIPEPFVEVTRFIKPGANAVQFTWRKDDGARVSTSRDDVFELKIGTGEFLAGVLQLNAITAVKHNAFETGTFKTDVSIEVPAK